ncbi:MAG: YMGG-like glycine zipper-containing protein [Fusobacteriaceae bacterium]
MKAKLIAAFLLTLALVGCAETSYQRRSAVGGAALGALAGQLIGGDSRATLIGAGIGAVAGGAVARHRERRYWDRGW